MKVTLSTWGKFHFFHLARQLAREGVLDQIFTTYPMFKLGNEQLDRALIRSDAALELLILGKWRFGLVNPELDRELIRLKVQHYDRFITRRLRDCDVFVGLSGSGLKAGRAVQKRGGKYICDRGSTHILHGEEVMAEEFALRGLPFRPTDRRLIERELEEYSVADRIVVPSSYCRDTYVAHGVDRGKIAVIPYGVELADFSPETTPDPARFVVTFVGALKLRKGVPYLLDAFRRLQHPHKELRLIGVPNEEVTRFLTPGDEGNVRLLGRMTKPELRRALSESDVFALASLEEGMALVQAEAMACGCAVVATDRTGSPDLFEDGREGFIVPARDVAAFATALQRLADDTDLRQAMRHAALQRVRSLGGWDDYGQRYLALLRDVAADRL